MVRKYTILISLLVMVIYSLAVLALEIWDLSSSVVGYVISGLVVFMMSFLIIRTFFVRFKEKNIDNSEITPDLSDGAETWSENQTKEIKKLRKMEKYRKDFLGNVSHELKTPIFNIQGYILTLLDGGMEDNKVNKLYLKRAEKSTNRLINIVDDLDSIARLESGEYKLQLEPFNLMKTVEEVIEDQEMQAKKLNIRIGYDGKTNKQVMVAGDRKRIQEVIANLVNNSIKYGRNGGKTTIGIMDRGKNVQVEISDDGVGISEKDLPRIFERFYTADKSRSRESGGTGLGLSIVKHTLQAHNQTISVSSKIDKGTTFVFSLDKAL